MAKTKNLEAKEGAIALLNKVQSEASPEYQARIPKATQQNLAQVMQTIVDWKTGRNDFLNLLDNQIGMTIVESFKFENPLAVFKRSMQYGDTVRNIYVEMAQASAYDLYNENNPFQKKLPNVLACYNEINRDETYKVTLQRNEVDRAFSSPQGLMDLVNNIIDSLQEGDYFDEYTLMKNIIFQSGNDGQIALERIPTITDSQDVKTAVAKIKEVSNNFMFKKQDYNYANVFSNTPKARQVLLISTKFDAQVDVELLATAFNMSKAEFETRKIVVDDFGGLQNVEAMLMDERWFSVYDSLNEVENIRNPEGRYWNYFLHRTQILGAMCFANAVLFVTDDTQIDTFTLMPQTGDSPTAMPGTNLQFHVEVTTTANVPAPSKSNFSISGQTSQYTQISKLGTLVLGKDETAATITVTATSTFDNTKTDNTVVTIV